MSAATERLARYIAAETAILSGGQQARADLGDGRGYRMLEQGDLAAVQQAIKSLQAEVRAETANAGGGMGFALARLDGEC